MLLGSSNDSHTFQPKAGVVEPDELIGIVPIDIPDLLADLARSWPSDQPIQLLHPNLLPQHANIYYAVSFRKPDMPPMNTMPVWNQELEVLYESVTPSTSFDQLLRGSGERQLRVERSLHILHMDRVAYSSVRVRSVCGLQGVEEANGDTLHARSRSGLSLSQRTTAFVSDPISGLYLARCRFYQFLDEPQRREDQMAAFLPDLLENLPKASYTLDVYDAPLSSALFRSLFRSFQTLLRAKSRRNSDTAAASATSFSKMRVCAASPGCTQSERNG